MLQPLLLPVVEEELQLPLPRRQGPRLQPPALLQLGQVRLRHPGDGRHLKQGGWINEGGIAGGGDDAGVAGGADGGSGGVGGFGAPIAP